jgi:hypothetical protein
MSKRDGPASRPPQPTRGVPGGWRDWWDGSEDETPAAIRRRIAQFDAGVAREGRAWRAELAAAGHRLGRRSGQVAGGPSGASRK